MMSPEVGRLIELHNQLVHVSNAFVKFLVAST